MQSRLVNAPMRFKNKCPASSATGRQRRGGRSKKHERKKIDNHLKCGIDDTALVENYPLVEDEDDIDALKIDSARKQSSVQNDKQKKLAELRAISIANVNGNLYNLLKMQDKLFTASF